MNILPIIDRASSEESLRERRCFACGLDPTKGTGEHVIPKWLQNELQLWDKTLKILNGTNIPYRQLTVPCCSVCNNGFLSRLESDARRIFSKGSIDDDGDILTIGRWLSKIFIGIVYKESGLLFDRSRPEEGNILSSTVLENFRHAHLIMQTVRKHTIFNCLHSYFPFSFYHYKIESRDDLQDFDLATNFFGQSIAIRVRSLGVVFVNDGGLQMEVGSMGPFGLSGSSVNEYQFRELYARIHYKSALSDATHFYLSVETDDRFDSTQAHVKSFSGRLPDSHELRIFNNWDERMLCRVMSAYMQVDESMIWDEEEQMCRSSLVELLG